MKSLQELKRELHLIGYEVEKKAERENMRQLILYIETNPSEELIKKQLLQVEKNLQ
jgi:hypothetical protein